MSTSLFHLLLRCAHNQNLKLGSSIHAHIIKLGSSPDIFLSNSVVNMYAKCHRLDSAHQAFDEMLHRDVVSWNSLINSYSHQGPPSSLTVLTLFKRFRAESTLQLLPTPFTFAGVFAAAAACAPGSHSSVGVQSHCVAIKTFNSQDVYVGSSLVNMYCKLGLLSDARLVFDRMPDRNSVSWATMISGYATDKCGPDAFNLFKLMLEGDESISNEFAVTSVLSAVSLPEFLKMGLQVHGLALKNGLDSFITVQNSLVTFYCKCGCLDDAVVIFLSSGDKTSITWSAMVTGYAQNGEADKSLALFTRMNSEGIRPNDFTFVGVLNACSDKVSLMEGEQAHAHLVKLGFELQVYVKSALVDMYAKCGNIDDARKGFNQLNEVCEADTVLWTTMMGGYVKNGEQEETLALYGTMQKEGISPNNLTIVTFLRACSCLAALEQGKQIHAVALKYGFGLGVPLGSALSTMYAKCGSLEDCGLVFRRIPQRDVVAWNSVISGFSQNGHGVEALDLFDEMKLEGVKPDYITFINLLFACSHMGLVERGWGYFDSMHKDHGLEPRIEHYACMVDILSRAGLFEEAKTFIRTVPIDHGTCLWRIVLGACREAKSFNIGAYAGERLMELGTRDPSAYILLSNIYASQRKWDDVERVRRTMRLRGVSKEPGCSWVELHNRVHVFVAGEDLHPKMREIYTEVRRLVEHMKDEGYRPNSRLPYRSHLELEKESYSEGELRLLASGDF